MNTEPIELVGNVALQDFGGGGRHRLDFSLRLEDIETLIKTFVNGLVKLGEGGPKLSSNGYGGSLLSGFIIQLRDWEEWLVNNRLRTVGGVGLIIEIEIGPSVLSL